MPRGPVRSSPGVTSRSSTAGPRWVPEVFSLLAGAVVVKCRHDEGFVEFAMSPDALTGFLAWLESAPPGRPPSTGRLS